jgi:hypothetical protein
LIAALVLAAVALLGLGLAGCAATPALRSALIVQAAGAALLGIAEPSQHIPNP